MALAFIGAIAPWIPATFLPHLQLIPIVLVYLLPLYLLFFLYYALIRRPGRGKRIFFSLIGLTIAVWIAGKDVQFEKNKAQLSPDIKLLSYNVQNFQFQSQLQEIVKLINIEQPDIICFQEFRNYRVKDDTRVLQYLSDAFQLQNYHFVAPTGIIGGAILSRYPILRVDTFFLHTLGVNVGMYAELETPNGPIGVTNIHLNSYRLHSTLNRSSTAKGKILSLFRASGKVLPDQYQVLKEIMRETRQLSHPVFIVGDMNAVPHSSVIHQVSSGYKDSFLESGLGLGWTFPIKNYGGLRIDYQFASPKIQIVGHKVLQIPYSDHYPIVGSYKL